MAPGQIARLLLGRHFERVGNLYRSLFVDLERVVDVFARALPRNARVLDIGGGDGALIDRLANRRPDIAFSMCDLAASIGTFLSEHNRAKIVLLPATDFTEVEGRYDAVTISDVIHHVPIEHREGFFEALAASCERWDCRTIILKDVEPRGLRAGLSLLADRHITGDKHVVLFSRAQFYELAARYFPRARRISVVPDWPNYCEVLSW
jgi:hypothetical protein